MNNRLHDAAADKNGLATVREIVEQDKSSLNLPHTEFGTKPAAFAAQTGSVETLRYLIEQGAEVDASAPRVKNLLEWAVQNTQEMIDFVAAPENKLIEKFNDGTTAFHAAIAAGRIDEVRDALNKAPSLIFKKNNKGMTAFDWMLLAKRYEIEDLFINHVGFYILANDEEQENYLACLNYLCEYAAVLCDINENQRGIEVLRKLITYCKEVELQAYILINLYCHLALMYVEIDDLTLAQEYYDIASELINAQSETESSSESEQIFEMTGMQLALSKAAKDRGFRCLNVKGDGACFYHALTDQLSLQNGKLAAMHESELRELAANHLRNNEETYTPFVSDSESYQSYLRRISRADSWVDHLAIQALSRELNATFVIVRSDGRKPDIIRQAEPSAILYFGYITEWHYQSLHRLIDAPPTCALLEAELNAAEVDTFTGVMVRTSPQMPRSQTAEIDAPNQSDLLKRFGHFSSDSASYSYSDEEEVIQVFKRRKK